MSGEVSYLSRFFVKFVEISAAGLASAICAYALAHFGGLLSSSPAPASAPAQTAVRVSPTASEVAGSLRAHPTPPAAAAAVNKQSPAPQQDTDAPVAQPARKAGKDAKALPPSKHTKTDTSVAEKEPRGQKSAEALARAALANVDANRPAPNDAPIEPTCRRARPMSGHSQSRFLPARCRHRPRTFSRSRSRPVRRSAPTFSLVLPTSGRVRWPLSTSSRGLSPPATRSHREPTRRSRLAPPSRRLRPSRTGACSPPSNGFPICCGPTRRRLPAKPRVRPCRSGRRRLK